MLKEPKQHILEVDDVCALSVDGCGTVAALLRCSGGEIYKLKFLSPDDSKPVPPYVDISSVLKGRHHASVAIGSDSCYVGVPDGLLKVGPWRAQTGGVVIPVIKRVAWDSPIVQVDSLQSCVVVCTSRYVEVLSTVPNSNSPTRVLDHGRFRSK